MLAVRRSRAVRRDSGESHGRVLGQYKYCRLAPVLALVQPVLPARPPSLELNKLALPRPSRILRHGPSQSSHRLCKSTEALCGLSADFARQIVLYVWPYLQAGPVGAARSQERRRQRRSVPVSNS
jgi:hypothetical protein